MSVEEKVEAQSEITNPEIEVKRKNYFESLAGIDVSNYIEKKNGFSYLSWAYAVDQLKRRHPNAQINVKRFPEASTGVLVPYMKTALGYFVEVEVVIDGVSVSEPFPVTDHRNKPITQPTSFDINNSIQRAKVKMIAGHGLGLYIYAGEDLPIESDEVQQPKQQNKNAQPAQPPQINNAQPVQPQQAFNPYGMTEQQKAQIRELATSIATLRLGAGATQEGIVQGMRGVYEEFKLTANLTSEMASVKINELTQKLNEIHNARMNPNPAGGGLFGAATPGNLSDVI